MPIAHTWDKDSIFALLDAYRFVTALLTPFFNPTVDGGECFAIAPYHGYIGRPSFEAKWL
jgi:hypothetical protein